MDDVPRAVVLHLGSLHRDAAESRALPAEVERVSAVHGGDLAAEHRHVGHLAQGGPNGDPGERRASNVGGDDPHPTRPGHIHPVTAGVAAGRGGAHRQTGHHHVIRQVDRDPRAVNAPAEAHVQSRAVHVLDVPVARPRARGAAQRLEPVRAAPDRHAPDVADPCHRVLPAQAEAGRAGIGDHDIFQREHVCQARPRGVDQHPVVAVILSGVRPLDGDVPVAEGAVRRVRDIQPGPVPLYLEPVDLGHVEALDAYRVVESLHAQARHAHVLRRLEARPVLVSGPRTSARSGRLDGEIPHRQIPCPHRSKAALHRRRRRFHHQGQVRDFGPPGVVRIQQPRPRPRGLRPGQGRAVPVDGRAHRDVDLAHQCDRVAGRQVQGYAQACRLGQTSSQRGRVVRDPVARRPEVLHPKRTSFG